MPSTWPGARAPHVFLASATHSIFDLLGTGAEYTLVDLSAAGEYAQAFAAAAARAKVPLKTLHLPDEPHLRRVWERDAVLVRPDDHVAWRPPAAATDATATDADAVLAIAAGKQTTTTSASVTVGHGSSSNAFTGTVGNQNHEAVEDLAAFQR